MRLNKPWRCKRWVNLTKILDHHCSWCVKNSLLGDLSFPSYRLKKQFVYHIVSARNIPVTNIPVALQWRHNGRDGVSNHQPHHCLLNRLSRCRSKKTSKLRVTGLCAGIHRWSVNSPHKGPITRKMFPFDDVIMNMMWCSGIGPWNVRKLDLHHSCRCSLCRQSISRNGIGYIT